MSAPTIPGFQGQVVTADHPDYDQNRRIWNALHDKLPAVIAMCASNEDVAAALAYGQQHDLPIAVRCGGHSVPGFSTVENGLVIDLRAMSTVSIDVPNRRARVQGGALLGDVDTATQAHGMVIPSGVISHTGVGGLTLGGGVGRMMRRYGLTIDNLKAVTMVTVDGRTVRADNDTNPELFWALRGGGGNFGVVTEFEFQTHVQSILPVLVSFLPLTDVPEALELGRQIMVDAPDEMLWKGMIQRVPTKYPWVPADLAGEPGLRVGVEWSGDHESGHRELERIAKLLPPGAQKIDDVSFLTLQRQHDEEMRHGIRSYAKATFVNDLPPELTAILAQRGELLGSPGSQIEVLCLGGAIGRVPESETAFAGRNAGWLLNAPANWFNPAHDEKEIAWARDTYDAMAAFGTGGAYSNFMNDDEPDLDQVAYGSTLKQLRAIKAEWDPGNVLRLNQNIQPLT